MSPPPDPFAFHPELRGQIVDPELSFFRTFTTARLEAIAREHGMPLGWWFSDAEREALRSRFLAGHAGGDLWLFAYGSLMWDPAIRFSEVRRARAADHARRFILKDTHGGRGSAAAPGLMAALDSGPGCDGLAFRIAAESLDRETEILWRREQVGPAYLAAMIDIDIDDRRHRALAFVADHDAALIDAGMTPEEQVRYLATGAGFLGTSLDYMRGIAQKFAALGIDDEEVTGLLAAAEAYLRAT